jgi:hypothetical protein
MFNRGDFIEVKDRGHLGRITRMDHEKVWVEWEHHPGIAYDYKIHEAFRFWDSTNKTFKNKLEICYHAAGISLSKNMPMIKSKNTKIDESLLEHFENILNGCDHEFESYWGMSSNAYDICKHCNQKMPYKHISNQKN